jgi:hypothetical protein
MSGNESPADRERREEAERILQRARLDSELVGGSMMARLARHFSGADAPAGDTIELWGRRIGRILAVIFAIYLVISLAEHFSR